MKRQVALFGIRIDNVSVEEALDEIEGLIGQNRKGLVVTPNAHHLSILNKDEEFRELYREAALVVTDSVPLVWASRILGQPIKERIAGSDLLPAFSRRAAAKSYALFLLGSEPGIAQEAAFILADRHPGLSIVGTYSPPPGFEREDKENEKIVDLVNRAHPDVLFVGLGSPKGEKWAWAHQAGIEASVIICVGAGFDFIAGKLKRAPLWMQKSGLEWFHRFSREPRRLWKRYLLGNAYLIWLVFQELINPKKGKKQASFPN